MKSWYSSFRSIRGQASCGKPARRTHRSFLQTVAVGKTRQKCLWALSLHHLWSLSLYITCGSVYGREVDSHSTGLAGVVPKKGKMVLIGNNPKKCLLYFLPQLENFCILQTQLWLEYSTKLWEVLMISAVPCGPKWNCHLLLGQYSRPVLSLQRRKLLRTENLSNSPGDLGRTSISKSGPFSSELYCLLSRLTFTSYF